LPYLTLGAALLLACKPSQEEEPAKPIEAEDAAGDFASLICAQLYECDCTNVNNFGVNESECVENLRSQMQMEMDTILGGGGSWDAQCAGELAKTLSDWSCEGPVSAGANNLNIQMRACPLTHGTLGEGEQCFLTTPALDPCAEGLSCYGDSCVKTPSLPVAVGGVCELGWENLPCVSGSHCRYDSQSGTSVCVASPKAGDPCSTDWPPCGPNGNDLWCNYDTNICEVAPGLGESCEMSQICGPGLYCDGGKEFTCQERFDFGEGCASNVVCPVDGVCVGNICEPAQAAICSAPYAI
jgi:hypothetical protein